MTEQKEFRVKRSRDAVVRHALEWARAHREWYACEEITADDALYERQKLARERLEASAKELANEEDFG